ncbi:MAG: carboxypeptidase-like regulatory domain-containing protein, partial [Saprospiraceae bacterium]|nr:carboxypeptidase-like regulatory domain-containing protein [Saprospiraceae bacterium]
MKRFITMFSLVLAMVSAAFAQRTVVGTVTGDDGEALVGASVAVKGAAAGARTDLNGKYSVQVPAGSDVLVFTYTGYATQEITLTATNVVDMVLASGLQLEEAVVTALGITRYKNELPYSAQKVEGDDVTRTRDANVVNSLSGKVAGLQIKRNNSLGGSTNVVLRGTKSFTGDNQALFVVDG